jgi:UDP-N-acetylglucosamine 1-carboxyvinyltransferase
VEKFSIEGPVRLHGKVPVSGAKNAALPALAATLLTDEKVELTRVPAVRDIRTMCRLLEHLGCECEVDGHRVVAAGSCLGGGQPDAPYELVKTMRASILVLGPLLARRGRATVSLPGGCAIGVRPIDEHLRGMEALGAEVELSEGYVTARARRLVGTRFRFHVPSVTGTENVMMAATLARGSTRLENCAREAEIADLAELLNAMGAKISGAGGDVIEIEGVDALHHARHEVIPDRIEAGTYLIAAAITGGDVEVEGARWRDLEALTAELEAAGVRVERTGSGVRAVGNGALAPTRVETAPHPGFPTDLQAQWMALMTQAEGTSSIRESVFENRFQHVAELNRLGADVQIDGRTAVIHGRRRLSGTGVMATDLRASACLVLAGLAAEGTTVVDRIYHLDRGYEAMESKLHSLGAQVERFSAPMDL